MARPIEDVPDTPTNPSVPGSVSINQTESGLPAGDYDVRLLLRRNSGTTTAYPYGTATVKAE